MDDTGFVRPFRRRVRHGECGTITVLLKPHAEVLALDPLSIPVLRCTACADQFPAPAFRWIEDDGHDGEEVGSGDEHPGPVTLARGAGQVTDIDLPEDCTALRFECATGNAQVAYQFPPRILQHIICAATLGPRRIEVPDGARSVKVTRFDDGADDVTVTLEPDARLSA